MKALRGGAVLALMLGLAACRTARRSSDDKIPDYVKANAEKAFDELAAEDAAPGPAWEKAAKSAAACDAFKPKADKASALLAEHARANDRAARPDYAWLISEWSGKVRAKAYEEPFDAAFAAALSSGTVVLADDSGTLGIRAVGPGDALRWETWRRASPERPTECPLTDGWEPATVRLSSDSRKLSFAFPFYNRKRCDDSVAFSWDIDLSVVPVKKSPTPSEIAAAEAVLKEYARLSAEADYDVMSAESSDPEAIDAFIAKWKETVSTKIDGKPWGESYGNYAVNAAREGEYVVFKDHRMATLRVSGRGTERRWEAWRQSHPKRPAECPISDGWEPVAVAVAADRRMLSYDQKAHSDDSCVVLSLLVRKELRRELNAPR